VAEGSEKIFTVVYYSKKTDRNVTKQIKAASESELWDRLRAKGIDVVSIKERVVAEGSEARADELSRLEHEVKTYLANGDDYSAKQVALGATKIEYKKHLRKIIRQAMYGKGPGQGGVMEGIVGQGVAETKQSCPECGGPAYEDRMLAEKQDACYHKVKSRYKVWPSAYASGALVQCRKKGAKNWGKKS
jgi:hypothetical protein